MPDREKVIKGLEKCIEHEDCGDCPYVNACSDPFESAVPCLMKDALELLKEQEPRVITREELKQFEGSPCWFESSGTYMGKDGFWIIPTMFRTFFAGMIMSYTSVLDGVGDCGELGLSAYNKAWRCWTARPTTEQREAVKWE